MHLNNAYFFKRKSYYYICIFTQFLYFFDIFKLICFFDCIFFFAFCFNLFSKYFAIKLLTLCVWLHYLNALL